MRFRLNEISLALEEEESLLPTKIAQFLKCSVRQLLNLQIVRCGIDARRKGRVLRVYSVEFSCAADDVQALDLLQRVRQQPRLTFAKAAVALPEVVVTGEAKEIVVVGMGPSGLFAALWLARAGHRVTLIERGRSVEKRVCDVEKFWSGDGLNPQSNVQFGEGGAGTFSDGKLTTRIKHPLSRYVLQTLVDFGAPEDIMWLAKPHVGTDRLRKVLVNFRYELQRLGVKICFESCLTDLSTGSSNKRQLQSITVNSTEELPCDALVLAIGHSARDSYELLERKGFVLQAKPFAVGVRVEHPAQLIDAIQYGHRITEAKSSWSGYKRHQNLPTADYSLAYNDPQSGRGIYSFCMCPGGEVVQSSSAAGMVVVNGMSNYKRAGRYSNSALVVTVRPDDFADLTPLAGVRFQQQLEHRAFVAGGSNYHVPAQNMLAFLGSGGAQIASSCRPGVTAAELSDVLPDFVVQGLRQALPHFERKMRGFITGEATLTAVESRTSAPLRIVRDQNGQAMDWAGVYPAGEGAGYAGGIMSAAIDGVSAALNICAAYGADLPEEINRRVTMGV